MGTEKEKSGFQKMNERWQKWQKYMFMKNIREL